MSRPFSYNDENFTVIGNVLFCHIIVTKQLDVYSLITEIPQEIYKRLLHKSGVFRCLGVINGDIKSYSVSVGVTLNSSNEKYYFYTGDRILDIGNYLIGYYILKDI